MKKLLFLLLFTPGLSWAGFTVCHSSSVIVDESSSTAQCVYFSDQSGGITQHDRVKLVMQSFPRKYIKWTTEPVEKTAQEKSQADADEVAVSSATTRAGAKAQYIGFLITPLEQRAFADVVKDEINTLRQWTVSFKAEVAAATNLANLQSRVATLPTLNDRTLSQLKTALDNKIDGGGVDQ